MSDLTYRYECEPGHDGGLRHTWAITGEHGGVHIWAQELTEPSFSFGDRYIGGVEVHYRAPMYDWDKKPHHNNCWLLNGPCWHDGSSLYFSENIEPMLHGVDGRDVPSGIHEYLNSELFDWYRTKLGSDAAQ